MLLAVGLSSLACGGAVSSDETELGVARAALTTLVVEAESATGAGTVEADATASGGQRRALTVVGTTATATFTTAGTIESGTVRVQAGECATSQWVKVVVDGVNVLTQQLTHPPGSWTVLPLSFASFPAGSHTVAFNYRQGSNGCALRFDEATFSVQDPPPPPAPSPAPIAVEAESATGAGVVGSDPSASGGQLRTFTTPYTTAYATFTTTAPMTSGTVRVRATSCGSTPWVKVLVDGHDFATTTVPAATWTELPLSVSPLPAGSHTIGFQYRWGGTGCALHVDKATFAFD